jgi:hypothetical protein
MGSKFFLAIQRESVPKFSFHKKHIEQSRSLLKLTFMVGTKTRIDESTEEWLPYTHKMKEYSEFHGKITAHVGRGCSL